MLYTKPINQITWDDIESFCQQRIAEGAYLDYKEDFPRKLQKTIAALANTLGGIILIGVEEDIENKPVCPVRGVTFKRGLHEKVINIILSNITPPVFPEITVLRDSSGKRAIVVVRIHQSHQPPHAIAGNTRVYLRTDNRNKPEELARVDEIEWLLNGRRKCVEFRKLLYDRAIERASNLYRHKKKRGLEIKDGWLTISLCPLYPKDVFLSPPKLLNEVHGKIKVPGRYGAEFPLPYTGIGRFVQDGIVFNEILDEDSILHTELNCFGLYFFRQTTKVVARPEGLPERIRAKEVFCRIEEFLRSGVKYYEEMGYWGYVLFKVHLGEIHRCGLQGGLQDVVGGGRILYSADTHVEFQDTLLVSQLETEKSRLVLQAAQRIGWAFDWDITEAEIERIFNKLPVRR